MVKFEARAMPPVQTPKPMGSFGGRVLSRLGVKPVPVAAKPVAQPVQRRVVPVKKPPVAVQQPRPRPTITSRTLERLGIKPKSVVPAQPPAVKKPPPVDHTAQRLSAILGMLAAPPKKDEAMHAQLNGTSKSVEELRAELKQLAEVVSGLPEALKPPPAPEPTEKDYVPPDSRLDRVLLSVGKFGSRLDSLEQRMSAPRQYELVRNEAGKITGSREVRTPAT